MVNWWALDWELPTDGHEDHQNSTCSFLAMILDVCGLHRIEWDTFGVPSTLVLLETAWFWDGFRAFRDFLGAAFGVWIFLIFKNSGVTTRDLPCLIVFICFFMAAQRYVALNGSTDMRSYCEEQVILVPVDHLSSSLLEIILTTVAYHSLQFLLQFNGSFSIVTPYSSNCDCWDSLRFTIIFTTRVGQHVWWWTFSASLWIIIPSDSFRLSGTLVGRCS